MAAILELRVRLLADKHLETRPQALARNLEDTEEAVIAHFAGSLSAEDKALVRAARRVRNKLLHCEFWTAEERLLSLNMSVARSDIIAFSFDTGEERSLDQLTADPSDARVFPWVLNGMAPGGLFETAEQTFTEAINIIIRLLDQR
jgi:hypothetical protein